MSLTLEQYSARRFLEPWTPAREDLVDYCARQRMRETQEKVHLRRCLGCGKKRTRPPHRFCFNCRKYLDNDVPVDDQYVPTKRECRRAVATVVAWLGKGRT